MNRSLRLLLTLSLISLLLALSACRSHRDEPMTTQMAWEIIAPQHLTHLSANIPASLDTATQRPRAITNLSSELTLDADERVYVVPHLSDKERQATSFRSVVTLVNKTQGRQQTMLATWQLEDHNWEGGLGKHYYLLDLAVDERMKPTNETDEWYMLAVTGGGNYEDTRYELSLGYPESYTAEDGKVLQLPEVTPGQRIDFSVPFATTWRRLKWNKRLDHFELYDNTQAVKFAPQGCFFVFALENYMTLGVDVQREMVLESNGYASKGQYNFTRVSEAGYDRSKIQDGADLVADLWESEDEAIPEYLSSPIYSSVDNRHYRIPFRLGSGSAFHLNKAPSSSNPTKISQRYLLWLQKVDPYRGRSASSAEGLDEMNVIYASADVNEPGRTEYVPRRPNYHTGSREFNYRRRINKGAWKPYLGKNYIIATIPQGVERGKSHLVKLRMIRPMIPIEYSGPQAFRSTRGGIALGSSGNKSWHIAFDTELLPFLTMPLDYLQEGRNDPSNTTASYQVPLLGWVQPRFTPGDRMVKQVQVASRTAIEGLTSAYAYLPDRKEVYAVMYKSDYDTRGQMLGAKTNNYMVAVRVKLDYSPTAEDISAYGNPQNKLWSGVTLARIEHYYLGPNLYLGHKSASLVAYAMNPVFWERIDPEAIVMRIVPFKFDDNVRYLYNGRLPDELYHTQIKRDGTREVNSDGSRVYAQKVWRYWVQPWLDDPEKPW